MKDDFQFFQNNPPRCLEPYDVSPYDGGHLSIDGHGQEINTFFLLQCKCGSKKHSVLGHYWTNPDTNSVCFVGPFTTKCSVCEIEHELFDIKYHGYEAELGYGYWSVRGEGAKSRFESPQLEQSSFALIARFEYTNDVFEDDFLEAKGIEKELFTWFSLHGICETSNKFTEICEYECA